MAVQVPSEFLKNLPSIVNNLYISPCFLTSRSSSDISSEDSFLQVAYKTFLVSSNISENCIPLLFPNIFFATAMMKTSHFGELLYALSSFKLPKKIVIMLSIIFRFFPSFYLEMKNNTRAFKLRTYKVSKLSEYFYYFIYFSVVPLMRRAELVSDELSQVAVLRGIESNNPRTSMFAEPLYFYEYIAIFLLAGLFLYEVF